ncbi:hypothetical protein [Streptococcus pneumoniae]|uniref:hypothetical protein n=1 Tax=Streptococcus pneumoniae TaxID=1313 RepID=UPI000B59289C|nr:hypothetical protein [Streptococcus pneumoniae]
MKLTWFEEIFEELTWFEEIFEELTWFEEIFEEYNQLASWSLCSFHSLINQLIDCSTFCLQNLGKGFLL